LHDVGLTIYGVTALTFMMAMYALERRHRRFVLAFGVVEAIWSLVALRRYLVAMRESRQPAGQGDEASR
jgi:hypothetical protein